MWLNGEPYAPVHPLEARRAGVAMIYQELLPVLNMSVAENVLLGNEPHFPLLGWIQKRELHRRARNLLTRLGVSVDTERKMGSLRLSEMQVVEIAKALAHRVRLLIMDEPTSALSSNEAEALFKIIREL